MSGHPDQIGTSVEPDVHLPRDLYMHSAPVLHLDRDAPAYEISPTMQGAEPFVGAREPQDDEQLPKFYRATYQRLVASMTVTCGTRESAEEVVQEAFVRLVPRWPAVSRYDDPEAWVRGVALKLATSRWRRARVAMRALPRLVERGPSVQTDESRLMVETALRALPLHLRHVLMLHYLLDKSVAEIASELQIAPGTVKSRLARGRDAARLVLTTGPADPLAKHPGISKRGATDV